MDLKILYESVHNVQLSCRKNLEGISKLKGLTFTRSFVGSKDVSNSASTCVRSSLVDTVMLTAMARSFTFVDVLKSKSSIFERVLGLFQHDTEKMLAQTHVRKQINAFSILLILHSLT